ARGAGGAPDGGGAGTARARGLRPSRRGAQVKSRRHRPVRLGGRIFQGVHVFSQTGRPLVAHRQLRRTPHRVPGGPEGGRDGGDSYGVYAVVRWTGALSAAPGEEPRPSQATFRRDPWPSPTSPTSSAASTRTASTSWSGT